MAVCHRPSAFCAWDPVRVTSTRTASVLNLLHLAADATLPTSMAIDRSVVDRRLCDKSIHDNRGRATLDHTDNRRAAQSHLLAQRADRPLRPWPGLAEAGRCKPDVSNLQAMPASSTYCMGPGRIMCPELPRRHFAVVVALPSSARGIESHTRIQKVSWSVDLRQVLLLCYL